jgi:hypothetical protein
MLILQKEWMSSSFTKSRCVSSLVDARCQRADNLHKICYCFCHPIAIQRIEQRNKVILHLAPRFCGNQTVILTYPVKTKGYIALSMNFMIFTAKFYPFGREYCNKKLWRHIKIYVLLQQNHHNIFLKGCYSG